MKFSKWKIRAQAWYDMGVEMVVFRGESKNMAKAKKEVETYHKENEFTLNCNLTRFSTLKCLTGFNLLSRIFSYTKMTVDDQIKTVETRQCKKMF